MTNEQEHQNAFEARKLNNLARIKQEHGELLRVLKRMMEIARTAMPDTYFQTDSRVNAARAIIKKVEK